MVHSMYISIHLFSFHVYVKTFPSCSYTMLISHPFLLHSFACSISLYLPPSFSSSKKKKPSPSFCLTVLLMPSPSPSPPSQSRIPGTVIPLCAAQCERMFNTTRTPGEETGKETRRVHTPRQRGVSHSAHIRIHDTVRP